jgi:hypothetical protein
MPPTQLLFALAEAFGTGFLVLHDVVVFKNTYTKGMSVTHESYLKALAAGAPATAFQHQQDGTAIVGV